MRECTKCGQVKSGNQFYSHGAIKQTRCKQCLSEYGAIYRRRPEVADRLKLHKKEYNARPRTKAVKFVAQFGNVRLEEALEWLEIPKENRHCWMCGELGSSQLDHDHSTGKIRGWAHAGCNYLESRIRRCPNPKRYLTAMAELFNI